MATVDLEGPGARVIEGGHGTRAESEEWRLETNG